VEHVPWLLLTIGVTSVRGLEFETTPPLSHHYFVNSGGVKLTVLRIFSFPFYCLVAISRQPVRGNWTDGEDGRGTGSHPFLEMKSADPNSCWARLH
jgi:hypothetical protein